MLHVLTAEGMKSSDFSAVLFSWTGFVLFCGLAKDWALDLLLCIVSRCKTSLTEVHSNRAEQLLLLSFLRPESCCNFPWLRLTHLPCMSWEVGFSLTWFISTAEREYKTEEGINRTEKNKDHVFQLNLWGMEVFWILNLWIGFLFFRACLSKRNANSELELVQTLSLPGKKDLQKKESNKPMYQILSWSSISTPS